MPAASYVAGLSTVFLFQGSRTNHICGSRLPGGTLRERISKYIGLDRFPYASQMWITVPVRVRGTGRERGRFRPFSSYLIRECPRSGWYASTYLSSKPLLHQMLTLLGGLDCFPYLVGGPPAVSFADDNSLPYKGGELALDGLLAHAGHGTSDILYIGGARVPE